MTVVIGFTERSESGAMPQHRSGDRRQPTLGDLPKDVPGELGGGLDVVEVWNPASRPVERTAAEVRNVLGTDPPFDRRHEEHA